MLDCPMHTSWRPDATRPACAGIHRGRGERGLSLVGLLAVLIPLVLVLILGLRIAPAYYEHQRVVSILAGLEESGQTHDASDLELRAAFQRRADIEDVTSVKSSDLVIEKSPDQKRISVEYTARIPVVQHVFLLIEFSASSRPVNGKP